MLAGRSVEQTRHSTQRCEGVEHRSEISLRYGRQDFSQPSAQGKRSALARTGAGTAGLAGAAAACTETAIAVDAPACVETCICKNSLACTPCCCGQGLLLRQASLVRSSGSQVGCPDHLLNKISLLPSNRLASSQRQLLAQNRNKGHQHYESIRALWERPELLPCPRLTRHESAGARHRYALPTILFILGGGGRL